MKKQTSNEELIFTTFKYAMETIIKEPKLKRKISKKRVDQEKIIAKHFWKIWTNYIKEKEKKRTGR